MKQELIYVKYGYSKNHNYFIILQNYQLIVNYMGNSNNSNKKYKLIEKYDRLIEIPSRKVGPFP